MTNQNSPLGWGKEPWVTSSATFPFLGLQAIPPSLVLIEVGGGSTPVGRDPASIPGTGRTPPCAPSSSKDSGTASLSGRAQASTPSSSLTMALPWPGARPAPLGTLVVELFAVLEREMAGLPADSQCCRENMPWRISQRLSFLAVPLSAREEVHTPHPQ